MIGPFTRSFGFGGRPGSPNIIPVVNRVVVGGTSGMLRYKDTPITTGSWTNPGTDGFTITSLTYGNDLYVAGSFQSVWTSTDATSWSVTAMPPEFNFYDVVSIAYGAGVYVAMSSIANVIATSTNGTDWTARTTPLDVNNSLTVVFGGTCFLASGGTSVVRSTNGITWSTVTTGLPSLPVYCIVWTGSEFVMATNNSNQAVRSSDGITWSPLTIGTRGTGNYYKAGAYAPDKGMVLMETNGYYRKSDSNLSNWVQYQISGITGDINSVIYDGTNFIAISDSVCKYSSDGISWTDITSNLNLGGQIAYALCVNK